MKFQLWLQENFPYCLEVTKETDGRPRGTLLSERDPLLPLSFRPNHLYFNPLFKTMGGALHPYLVNGDNELVSIFTGRVPKRFKRAVRDSVQRGWFELTPRPIPINEIPLAVENLIINTPKLKGVIAQVAATIMGLRIPENISPSSTDDWHAWFVNQQVLLTPRMREAFTLASTRTANLIFHLDVSTELATGVAPEKLYPIQVRWFEQRSVKIIQNQIFESQTWDLEVPRAVLNGGEEAILKFADEKLKASWRTVESYPVGADKVAEEIDPQNKIEGPLIWVQTINGRSFVLLNPINADRPTTINDLLQRAINNDKST